MFGKKPTLEEVVKSANQMAVRTDYALKNPGVVTGLGSVVGGGLAYTGLEGMKNNLALLQAKVAELEPKIRTSRTRALAGISTGLDEAKLIPQVLEIMGHLSANITDFRTGIQNNVLRANIEPQFLFLGGADAYFLKQRFQLGKEAIPDAIEPEVKPIEKPVEPPTPAPVVAKPVEPVPVAKIVVPAPIAKAPEPVPAVKPPIVEAPKEPFVVSPYVLKGTKDNGREGKDRIYLDAKGFENPTITSMREDGCSAPIGDKVFVEVQTRINTQEGQADEVAKPLADAKISHRIVGKESSVIALAPIEQVTSTLAKAGLVTDGERKQVATEAAKRPDQVKINEKIKLESKPPAPSDNINAGGTPTKHTPTAAKIRS